jgi:4'-phosphopantetheinyl transferase
MGRHALRVALAAHCGQAAPDLRIGTNAFGKPRLVDWPKLQFNVSHSEQLAIIGISHVASVGVDIERLRANCSNADMVRAHFTADEAATWHQAPPSERDHVFLTVWTRKEACLKAWGVGLSLAPRDVRVGLGTGGQPLQVRSAQARGDIRLWRLRPTPDSVAAVALCHDAQAGAG